MINQGIGPNPISKNETYIIVARRGIKLLLNTLLSPRIKTTQESSMPPVLRRANQASQKNTN
tara:strand:+ start:558 stop:743 length:186 start_codon:yes stop_codon:yes gene_type:complete